MELLTGLGLAIPAGLNAYIPLLTVAVAQAAGWIDLSEPYSLLGEWWAIALMAVLLAVEVIADKVPAVDHVNDAIQTFVRPAAGGILVAAFAAGGGKVHPVVYIVVGIVVAGGVHAAKATARPAVNATTAGTATPVVSAVEDAAALVMSIAAIVVPLLGAAIAVGLGIWLVRRALARRGR